VKLRLCDGCFDQRLPNVGTAESSKRHPSVTAGSAGSAAKKASYFGLPSWSSKSLFGSGGAGSKGTAAAKERAARAAAAAAAWVHEHGREAGDEAGHDDDDEEEVATRSASSVHGGTLPDLENDAIDDVDGGGGGGGKGGRLSDGRRRLLAVAGLEKFLDALDDHGLDTLDDLLEPGSASDEDLGEMGMDPAQIAAFRAAVSKTVAQKFSTYRA
jgi:hypothetical protein